MPCVTRKRSRQEAEDRVVFEQEFKETTVYEDFSCECGFKETVFEKSIYKRTKLVEESYEPKTSSRRLGCYSFNLKEIPPHANDVTNARSGNHRHRSSPPNLETRLTRTSCTDSSCTRDSSKKVLDELEEELLCEIYDDWSSRREAKRRCKCECECASRCFCCF
ncbi:hypothetical protein HDV63DRAFT_369764 [Trichoderma sp. SZMC 28014]